MEQSSYLVARLNVCFCYAVFLVPAVFMAWKMFQAFVVWLKVMDVGLMQAQQKKNEFEEKYDSGYYHTNDR